MLKKEKQNSSKKKIVKKIATAIIPLVASGIVGNMDAQQMNFLNTNNYGFENGGRAFQISDSDCWSITDDKAAEGGSYSLKYVSAETISGVKKVNGGLNNTTISLPAGTYTVKVKVWIEPDAEISGFIFLLKKPWTNFKYNFDGVERGKWVELSLQKTFTEDVVNSLSLVKIDNTHTGKGTFYIDDIQIWGEKIEEPKAFQCTSSILTQNDKNLTLAKGEYNMSMKVFVENDATIKNFYTIIKKPWINVKWDLDKMHKGNWVELSQPLTIKEDIKDAPFMIQVCNTQESGGNSGSFYIDDIAFAQSGTTSINNKEQLFGYNIYPNPSEDVIYVDTEEPTQYKLYSANGNLVKTSSLLKKNQVIQISSLTKGIYLLHLINNKNSVVKTVIKR